MNSGRSNVIKRSETSITVSIVIMDKAATVERWIGSELRYCWRMEQHENDENWGSGNFGRALVVLKQ